MYKSRLLTTHYVLQLFSKIEVNRLFPVCHVNKNKEEETFRDRCRIEGKSQDHFTWKLGNSVIDEMADKLPKDTILNIPQLNRGALTPTSSRATPTAPASEVSEDYFDQFDGDEFEDGIGEFDDGRSGKITLGVLIQDGILEAGDGVMAVDYLGQTFKGDLLSNGKIKSQETGLLFNNPSAWAIYCKKIVNPSKKSGCGERK